MKTIRNILVAATMAGSMAVGVMGAEAQEWRKGAYPYAREHHRTCQAKAMRLWRYERAVTADHKLTKGELVLVAALKRDLDKTCGRYRLHRVRQLRHGEWNKAGYPYARKHHRVCQEKAIRLWRFERSATADHKLTKGEVILVAALKRDLDKTCGRYRYRR